MENKKKHGLLVVFATAICLSCGIGIIPEMKEKLLIYATVENSLKLHKNDTSWLNGEVCVELKIDTVYLGAIKEFKKYKDRFYYNYHVFEKEQLFELDKLQYLKQFKIDGFGIDCAQISEYMGNYNLGSNCFDEEQEELFKMYWKICRRYKEKCKISFYGITITNPTDNKTIELNEVVCYIE